MIKRHMFVTRTLFALTPQYSKNENRYTFIRSLEIVFNTSISDVLSAFLELQLSKRTNVI